MENNIILEASNISIGYSNKEEHPYFFGINLTLERENSFHW
jgi:hypothetical protein